MYHRGGENVYHGQDEKEMNWAPGEVYPSVRARAP